MKKLLFGFFTLAACSIVQAQTVTTYAGTGDPGYSGSGKSFLQAKFDNPYGVAFDSKGKVWVTDVNNNFVILLDPSNTSYYRRAGGYTANIPGYDNTGSPYGALFQFPRGIAVGAGDTIFIADNQNHSIRRMTPFIDFGHSQSVTILAGGGPPQGQGGQGASGYADAYGMDARFENPVGVAVSPDKSYLIVADQANQVLRKVDLKNNYGRVTTYAGLAGDAGNQDGSLSSARFNSPEGVWFDSNGDLYVADFSGGIRKISGNSVTTVVDAFSVDNPSAVVKAGNALYIADGCNVKRKDLVSGALTEFAGQDTACDLTNGDGSAAHFFGIGGMAVSPDGKFLLIADQFNNVIRKMTISDVPTGIEENALETSFSLYPNPAQDVLRVAGVKTNSVISIFDMAGRQLEQTNALQKINNINVSGFANGVYLLRVATGSYVSSKRVVIAR